MYDEGETAVLTPPDASERTARIDGVVIGTLAGFADDGTPLVAFPGAAGPVPARTLAALEPADLGAELALMFEAGDPARPVVAGRLLRPEPVDRPSRDGEDGSSSRPSARSCCAAARPASR